MWSSTPLILDKMGWKVTDLLCSDTTVVDLLWICKESTTNRNNDAWANHDAASCEAAFIPPELDKNSDSDNQDLDSSL